MAQVIANARRVNPDIAVLQVSAETGEGMDAWLDWLRRELPSVASRREENVAALKQRVAELETELLSLRASLVK